MKNFFAIIDESGRLYDPEDRFLVFVAGAFRVKYAKNISQFADKIENRVEGRIITSWRALKQKR